MSEATSVGKIQLDFELNKDSISKELKKINSAFSSSTFKGSVNFSKGFEKQFSKMFTKMNQFSKNTVKQVATGNTDDVQQPLSLSKENDKAAKSAEKIAIQYDKAKTKVDELKSKIQELQDKQNKIINAYEEMPALTGMSKDESVGKLLDNNQEYNGINKQIDALEEKLKPLTAELNRLKEQNKDVSNSFKDVEKSIDITSKKTNRFKAILSSLAEQLSGIKGKFASMFDNIAETSNKAFGKLGGFVTNINNKFKSIFKSSGNAAQKAGGKFSNFGSTVSSAFGTILKRIFVFGLIYKALQSMIRYMNSALKTNSQFVNSLNTLKTNLRVAFQPIYDFILPAINALMNGLAMASTYVASAISSLFGKTYKQSYDGAKGIETAQKAMDGYGASAKKAQGMLAGFDKLNVIGTEEDDSGSGASGGFEMQMPDTSEIDLTGFDKFKELLQPTIDALGRLKTALEPFKDFVATGVKDFYENCLKPIGAWAFGEGLPRFIDALANGLTKVNWQPINNGLNKLWKAITPFAINIGEGLLWFWENVLVPIGTWTLNEVVPRFLDILAKGIDILNIAIEKLKPVGKWLFDNFLKPLGEWTGGVIIAVLDGISTSLDGIASYISNVEISLDSMNPKVEEFKNSLNGIWVGLGEPLKDWFTKDFIPFMGTTIKSLGTIVSGLFDSFNTVFSDIWNIVVYPVLENFLTSGLPMITDFVSSMIEAYTIAFEEVKEIFDMLWEEGVAPALEIIVDIWNDTIDSLSSAWDTYGEPIFDGIKEAARNIGTVLKTVWETTLKPVWDTFMETVTKLWVDHLKPLLDNFLGLVGEFILAGQNLFNNFIIPIVKAFVETFGPKIAEVFQTVIRIVGNLLETCSDVISGVITVIRGIIQFLTGVFTGDWKSAWNGIVTIFKGIFQGIGGIVKGVVNTVIDLVNGMIKSVTNGLNFIINALNKIKFDVPDWVPGIGGNSWGIKIDTLDAFTIPKLARGGIVDQPTLAMIGEAGKEAVIPLENTGFVNALASAIGNAVQPAAPMGGNDTQVSMYLDGDLIGKAVVDYINQQTRRSGSTVIDIR